MNIDSMLIIKTTSNKLPPSTYSLISHGLLTKATAPGMKIHCGKYLIFNQIIVGYPCNHNSMVSPPDTS